MTDAIDLNAENAAARERVLALVSGLTNEQLGAPLDDGWTIAAELAHLAFWDRVHVARLRAALEAGGDMPGPFPAGAVDALNDSGLHGWRLIPGDAAITLFAQASADVDAYVSTLDAATIDRVRSAGIPRHVERFRHRRDHAIAIERGRRSR
jgi:hypothetical protein